ncbi:response regulator [Ideonella sp.]|uniref:response regulator n=1 Tax=Ideonella sp. TaxID=1929293 RepID=UPI002B475CC7|nr:response regulator [Ideonella sp.]HJV72430.1 response regulator [Ideonella sp.]
MTRADRDFSSCKALIIDGHPTSRSILAAQLRDLGVGTVIQCSRIADARRQLEAREFDLVLCEQHFQDGKASGQSLLDDLRRAQLLPFSTVFVMVTGEASYTAVAEAAESALDSYLLKPFAATSLAERLLQARKRKRVLREIFTAVESGDFDHAARLCLVRFHDRAPYWLYAARIGAELLLRLGRHDAAQKLFQAVIDAQALPWARLGIARSQLEGGKVQQARRTLEVLISDDPSHADAYDVMGRVHVEQGAFGEALETYRMATQLTPGSIERLQRQGMLAFYVGEHAEARRALERAASIGITSKMFDLQSMVLLAFARFRDKDGKGLQRCADNVRHVLERNAESPRLRRFGALIDTLVLMLNRQVARVLDQLRSMAHEIRRPDYDVEAALNMVTLLSELAAAELRLEEADEWVDNLAMRFCVSKSLSELLAKAAGTHLPYADRVRGAHAKVTALAEASMNHSLNGEPRTAAKALLAHGAKTQNTKLIDMARMVLQRHAEKIDDAADLHAMADELYAKFASSTTPGFNASNHNRQSGGLALRASATPSVAAPMAPADRTVSAA